MLLERVADERTGVWADWLRHALQPVTGFATEMSDRKNPNGAAFALTAHREHDLEREGRDEMSMHADAAFRQQHHERLRRLGDLVKRGADGVTKRTPRPA
jgi:hypothetical protein